MTHSAQRRHTNPRLSNSLTHPPTHHHQLFRRIQPLLHHRRTLASPQNPPALSRSLARRSSHLSTRNGSQQFASHTDRQTVAQVRGYRSLLPCVRLVGISETIRSIGNFHLSRAAKPASQQAGKLHLETRLHLPRNWATAHKKTTQLLLWRRWTHRHSPCLRHDTFPRFLYNIFHATAEWIV